MIISFHPPQFLTSYSIALRLVMVLHASQLAAAAIHYIGCFDDSSSRLLNGSYKQTPGNTPESCGVFCDGLGYKYAGVEFGNQCFCGADLPSNATEAACSTPCAGNDQETCGGIWTLSIYEITSHSWKSSPSISLIVGPVIGGVVALALVLYYMFRRRKHQRNNAHPRKIEIDSPLMGNESPPPTRIEVFPPSQRNADEEVGQSSYPPSGKGAQYSSPVPKASSSLDTAVHEDASEQRLLVLQDQVASELARVREQRYGEGGEVRDVPPPYESS